MNLITKFCSLIRRKHIAPMENDQSSVDISNDITTYIRCLFHDFRGPLNNISMAVDVLLGSTDKKSQDYETLKIIKDSCLFMSESLDGFLNLQNLQNTSDLIVLKYEPFHIVGLIKKVQYILMFNIIDKKIEIQYNIKPLHEWVIGDHKHIQHVLVNLLSNAVKFSKNNSKIMIKLESKPIVNKKQPITISVMDENTWIAPEIKARLFQKYVTSDSDRGTGLGLYICKKIIEQHGGTIVHENYSGRSGNDIQRFTSVEITGNLFKIELELEVCASGSDSILSEKKPPISRKADSINSTGKKILDTFVNKKTNSAMLLQENDAQKYNMLHFTESSRHLILDNSEPSDQHKKKVNFKAENGEKILDSQRLKCDEIRQTEIDIKIKVFIVDDSELSRKLMKRLFEQNCENMKLYEAEDGLDAVTKLHTRIHVVNLILLDNIMPNMTGVLLSKILRGIGYKGLIFGITGNGLDADRDEFMEAGANYVFTKPFNKEKFDKMMYFIQNNGYEIVPNGKIIESESGKLGWRIFP